MAKTAVQEKLEAKRDQDIREIVTEALDAFRGQGSPVGQAAESLGVSRATFHQWCRELGISPQDTGYVTQR